MHEKEGEREFLTLHDCTADLHVPLRRAAARCVLKFDIPLDSLRSLFHTAVFSFVTVKRLVCSTGCFGFSLAIRHA